VDETGSRRARSIQNCRTLLNEFREWKDQRGSSLWGVRSKDEIFKDHAGNLPSEERNVAKAAGGGEQKGGVFR